MQILIIGGGSMGCLFGAFLSLKADVTICDTNPTVIDSIQRNGILIDGMDGRTTSYKVDVVAQGSEYSPQADLVIIFTKANATRAAAESAQEVLAPDGLVLTLQNGVGHLEQINEVLGKEGTVAGVTAQAANVITPGHIRHAGAGMTSIAMLQNQEEQISRILDLFTDCGIKTCLSEDVEGLIWSKLIVNVGINALTAILKVPNGVLAEHTESIGLMEQVVAEAVAVADGLGITLPYDDPMQEVIKVCRVTAANRASMLQDILKNVPTEIDVINGAIVTKGKQVGACTPANSFIIALIKAMEATGSKRIRE